MGLREIARNPAASRFYAYGCAVARSGENTRNVADIRRLTRIHANLSTRVSRASFSSRTYNIVINVQEGMPQSTRHAHTHAINFSHVKPFHTFISKIHFPIEAYAYTGLAALEGT